MRNGTRNILAITTICRLRLIAKLLHGDVVWQAKSQGLWTAVLLFDRPQMVQHSMRRFRFWRKPSTLGWRSRFGQELSR